MADITIADLLHWERGLTYLEPAGLQPGTGLDSVISWAVTMRVSAPILPPLRGGEIVIALPATLNRIEQSEMIDRREVLRTLAGQPIAALMVDRTFEPVPCEGVALLVSSTLTTDTEPVLNRLFTERRAELYRLGSELSRALSTATLAEAGIDALLDAAEMVGGQALILLNNEGAVFARSRGAGTTVTFDQSTVGKWLQASEARPVQGIAEDGQRWLGQRLRPPNDRIADRTGFILAIAVSANASMEVERLVLTQTANVVELSIGRTRIGHQMGERGNREALLADLLLGRQVSRESAEARLRLIGLDPARPARVALFVLASDELITRVRSNLPLELGRGGAALGGGEYAVILTDERAFPNDYRDLMTALRSIHALDATAVLSVSEPAPSAAHASAALEEARMIARLMRAGAIDAAAMRADEIDRLGIYSLFIPAVAGLDSSPVAQRERLSRFASALLSPIDEHDQRRSADLTRTLETYLRLGGALAQAADELGIHRNTLSYRLERVAELTGRDLADPHTRFLFQIALALRSLDGAMGDTKDRA